MGPRSAWHRLAKDAGKYTRKAPRPMTEDGAPVRYVLYSHYSHREEHDFKSFASGSPPDTLDGIRHLVAHFRGLRELLTSPGHEGLLVLFYAPGYQRFLKGLVAQDSDEQLLHDSYLRFADAVSM